MTPAGRSRIPAQPAASSWPLRRALRAFPALDGLRGVAVLLVVTYHLSLPAGIFTGAFVGVDVFFVLSGFLITSLLLREFSSSQRVSYGAFYARRARRLLPALGVVLIPFAVGGLGLLVLRGRTDIAWAVFAGATYWSNWLEVDGNDFAPLFHLWSLAIEEQYYLWWPVTLVVMLRSRLERRTVAQITVGLAAASAVARAVLLVTGLSPEGCYYATPLRLDGILLGSAIAMVYAWFDARRLTRWVSRSTPAASAVMVGLLFVLHQNGRSTYTWGLALAAVCATVVLASTVLPTGPAPAPTRAVRHALNAPALRWLGRRSYAIYLFTWPVQAILEQELQLNGALSALVILVVCLPAAELSYRVLERPVLERRFLRQRYVRPLVRPRRVGSSPTQ